MFYAIVAICTAAASPGRCDVEHALYASQSAPIFESEDECLEGARQHVIQWARHEAKEGERYLIDISCEVALGRPA